MSLFRTFLSLRLASMLATSCVALLLFSDGISAQAPQSVPPPHNRKLPAPSAQEQFLAYWTTETGWMSELQLRNNAPDQSLTVVPALRLPNGDEVSLGPIVIQPQEVKAVDIDAAATSAGAPQFIGTYGSAILRYTAPTGGVLYAAVMIHRAGHPIAFHVDAAGDDSAWQAGSREGIWWMPNESASDYLVVSNQSAKVLPVNLSLYDSGGKETMQAVILQPRETKRVSVRQMLRAAGITGSYGGIKVRAEAHAGSLNTLHFLFDETAGFSAILKMFDRQPNITMDQRDYARTNAWTLRAPMLALNQPDPELRFPQGTKLQPQILVRNTTAKPADIAQRFRWRGATGTGTTAGPLLRLQPFETRRVDIGSLQDGKMLPADANWASVVLTTNTLPDEVLAVAASYDSTLRYGAQTPFSDQLTYKWEGGMWEYDPYHNSIVTAGNGGTQPTQAAFTLFYHQGSERFEVEQSLKPDEQMWINIGKLIREQVPDKNGKLLPKDLTSGSYQFRDLTHRGRGTLFEGKVVFDKTNGHAAYGCAACCGYDTLHVAFYDDPLDVPFNGAASQDVMAPDECEGGALAGVSDSFYGAWSTTSSSIATVDTYGNHTGVAVGTTTSQTHGYLNNNDARHLCPLKYVTPSGGDNVQPTVTIDSFSPDPISAGGTANVHVTVNPASNILLSIASSGTGSATFGTSGNTTITIPETTTVNVTAGNQSSNGAADLTLTASYNGTALASTNFSVTSGACSASYSSHGGDGPKNCPANVTVYDIYTIVQFCPTCTFTCIPISYDSTFTPSNCGGAVGSTQGSGTVSLTASENGAFNASDHNWHNLQIQTTVTNAQGTVTTRYTGGNIQLKCN